VGQAALFFWLFVAFEAPTFSHFFFFPSRNSFPFFFPPPPPWKCPYARGSPLAAVLFPLLTVIFFSPGFKRLPSLGTSPVGSVRWVEIYWEWAAFFFLFACPCLFRLVCAPSGYSFFFFLERGNGLQNRCPPFFLSRGQAPFPPSRPSPFFF